MNEELRPYGTDSTDPPAEPLTREEQYLSAIAGVTSSSDIPEKPLTRVEEYLNKIVENGGGGGGGFTPTDEQLAAMNSGITSTDVEQIGTNENNILSLLPTAYIVPTFPFTTKTELIYGGYVIIGNMCVVNMRFSVTDTITKGNNIVTGLPKCANMGSLNTGASFSSLNANNVTAGTLPQLVITKFNNTQCAISIATAGTDLTTGTHLVSGIYLIDNE
jgi:hypothetical protein